ncbi:MAG: hypothetical protein ACXABO_21230 [Promethearchaeota archaeon]
MSKEWNNLEIALDEKLYQLYFGNKIPKDQLCETEKNRQSTYFPEGEVFWLIYHTHPIPEKLPPNEVDVMLTVP